MSTVTIEVNTPSLVLSQGDMGEADAYLDILTTQMGRVSARARGVMHLRSKLRYSLQPYSLGQVNLIRSKTDNWLLINATIDKNLFFDAVDEKPRLVMVRLVDLIRRIMPQDELSSSLNRLLRDMSTNYDYVIENYLLYATGLLSELGYFDLSQLSIPKMHEWLADPTEEYPKIILTPGEVTSLKQTIAAALRYSQL